ncbi:unnamed protein product, partial [Phaedon cochleariae]
ISGLLFLLGIIILIRLYLILSSSICTSKVCLVGKTALVTGGSSGIGYQTVLGLAARGCRVIVADKNIDEEIQRAMMKETNNPNIIMQYVDLASFESVRELVNRLTASEDKLDILINNAGIGRGPNILSEDNLDVTWQINYFSAFLLTHLLVELLKKSTSGRIVFTSSILSHMHSLSLKNITANGIKSSDCTHLYQDTKVALIIASDIFAMKLNDFNITSNVYHPGVAKTAIFEKTQRYMRGFEDMKTMCFVRLLLFFFGQSPEQAAQTALHLAVSREVENITGRFFGRLSETWKPRICKDKTFCEKIWTSSETMIKLKPDERL